MWLGNPFSTHTLTHTRHTYLTGEEHALGAGGGGEGKLASIEEGEGMRREIKWLNTVELLRLCAQNVMSQFSVWFGSFGSALYINSYEIDFYSKDAWALELACCSPKGRVLIYFKTSRGDDWQWQLPLSLLNLLGFPKFQGKKQHKMYLLSFPGGMDCLLRH